MIERLDVQPNAPSELPFPTAVVNAAELSMVQFPTAVDLTAPRRKFALANMDSLAPVRHFLIARKLLWSAIKTLID